MRRVRARLRDNHEVIAMWIPKDEVKTLAAHHRDLGSRPDGTIDWQTARETFRYLPPGFVEWGVMDVGNGDCYGYYWPVGLEEQPPIAVATMHDSWTALPVASSLESCLLLAHAKGWGEHEWEWDDLLKELGLK